MPRGTHRTKSRKAPRKRRRRRTRARAFVSAVGRATRRAFQKLKRAHPSVQVIAGVIAAVTLALAVNWSYQVVRKPSELFFPVSERFHKTPAQTWRTYQRLFRKHSTSLITPELLAALAQVEAMGNPVARTYWRWRWTLRPFDLYRPASSSVGMYQMTNATFADARRFCIRNNTVIEQGPWHDLRSCWFNGLYTRVIPSHAIELTSVHLHRSIERIQERQPAAKISLEHTHELAAVIHLCGATAGARYVRAGFPTGWRCGAHDLDAYRERVRSMRHRFLRLSEDDA